MQNKTFEVVLWPLLINSLLVGDRRVVVFSVDAAGDDKRVHAELTGQGADGGGAFSMSWNDSQTGVVHIRSFNVDGDYIGSSGVAEIANSDEFFKGMGQQFIEIAMGNLKGNSSVAQKIASQQVTPEMIAVCVTYINTGSRFFSINKPAANDLIWEVVA
jgi:hypothetical protein